MTEKKQRLKPYLEESFTNEKGHVIQPGDPIVIVTICSHSPNVNIGKYLGKRKTRTWGNKEHYNVVVSVNQIRTKMVRKDDESVEWTWDYDKIPGLNSLLPEIPPRMEYPRKRYNYSWDLITSDPEYDRKMDQYRQHEKNRDDVIRVRNKIIQRFKEENYHEVKIPYTRYATLQCNLIYPINMQLKDW